MTNMVGNVFAISANSLDITFHKFLFMASDDALDFGTIPADFGVIPVNISKGSTLCRAVLQLNPEMVRNVKSLKTTPVKELFMEKMPPSTIATFSTVTELRMLLEKAHEAAAAAAGEQHRYPVPYKMKSRAALERIATGAVRTQYASEEADSLESALTEERERVDLYAEERAEEEPAKRIDLQRGRMEVSLVAMERERRYQRLWVAEDVYVSSFKSACIDNPYMVSTDAALPSLGDRIHPTSVAEARRAHKHFASLLSAIYRSRGIISALHVAKGGAEFDFRRLEAMAADTLANRLQNEWGLALPRGPTAAESLQVLFEHNFSQHLYSRAREELMLVVEDRTQDLSFYETEFFATLQVLGRVRRCDALQAFMAGVAGEQSKKICATLIEECRLAGRVPDIQELVKYHSDRCPPERSSPDLSAITVRKLQSQKAAEAAALAVANPLAEFEERLLKTVAALAQVPASVRATKAAPRKASSQKDAPSCSHCKKLGRRAAHAESECWALHPEKRPQNQKVRETCADCLAAGRSHFHAPSRCFVKYPHLRPSASVPASAAAAPASAPTAAAPAAGSATAPSVVAGYGSSVLPPF